MDWKAIAERQTAKYDGMGSELSRGGAAYGAGLALTMLGRRLEANGWFERSAVHWRASWDEATPTSWGRPIGVIKALLLAGDDQGAADAAEWALTLGCVDAESPVGRYAATLALLVLARWEEARHEAMSVRERDDFPHAVADSLAFIAAHDVVGYQEAVEAVVESFETRDAYFEDVAVADTAMVLQVLAERRGFAAELSSPLLPGRDTR